MKKLNETITLLTNIGVLLGLVFLIYEINQNTIAIENEADAAIYGTFISGSYVLAESADLAELISRTPDTKWGDFTEADKIRIDGIWSSALDTAELQFRMFQRRGEVPDNILFDEGIFKYPSFQSYWSEVKGFYDPEFVMYFEGIMNEV